MNFLFPIATKFRYGYKPGDHTFYDTFHLGYDIIPMPIALGVPVLMPMSGTVEKINFATREGNELAIVANENGHIIRSYMCHLQRYEAGMVVGKKVLRGEVGAYVGKTGELTEGAHLHWHMTYDGNLIDQMKYLDIDQVFIDKHKGKIFLQVESKGEAWYIDPRDGKRYALGKPAETLQVMQARGIGITNKDLLRFSIGKI